MDTVDIQPLNTLLSENPRRVRAVLYQNHYTWLDSHFDQFLDNMKHPRHGESFNGMIVAHGDKCYGYKPDWAQVGIPFEHGVAMYLLTYLHPWSSEVRETKDRWVDPWVWVIENYSGFSAYLPPAYVKTEI